MTLALDAPGAAAAQMRAGAQALHLPAAEQERVAAFLGPRAEAVDAGRADIREGLAFLQGTLLEDAAGIQGPNTNLVRVAETIATAAASDMSTAFALWCQRMVLEYLAHAPADSSLRQRALPRMRATELLGSTALAAAMAHHVSGVPLAVTWRREHGHIVLDGRISWASNLHPGGFVMVTAAAHADDGRAIFVAVPGDAPGLEIAPYPRLMALQATYSSSGTLRGVRVPVDHVVTEDFTRFVTDLRPAFLLLQSSFCCGLAGRALAESAVLLRDTRGPNEVLRPDLEVLEATAARLSGAVRLAAASRGHDLPIRDVVRLRLECAQLATASVALEAKAAGGRGYVVNCATARRLREAAFLPIQAPTEGQLRWELARSA